MPVKSTTRKTNSIVEVELNIEGRKTGQVYKCDYALSLLGSSKNDPSGILILEVLFDETPLPLWYNRKGEAISGSVIFRDVKRVKIREFYFNNATIETISGAIDLSKPSTMLTILKLNAESIRIS
jgi:hypothetical protein